jgi:hypothetical protein
MGGDESGPSQDDGEEKTPTYPWPEGTIGAEVQR